MIRQVITSIAVTAMCVALTTPVFPAASGPEPVGPVPVPSENPLTGEKIEFGKKLFFDRRLSGDGTMSCASCHIPEQGFTDGQEISLSYPTTKNWRNTPTLINIGFSRFLFHDGRAGSLEEQALFPVMSSFEMNLNLDYLEEKIRQVSEYRDTFMKIFGRDVDRQGVAMALASFQRSLVSKNSPLDRFLTGDSKALSREAKRGFGIFKGKGGCVRCHYGVNLSDDGFHALNIPEKPEQQNDARIAVTRRFVAKVAGYKEYRELKEDLGRYLITGDRKDWKAFKTPTLREIAKTAPYMHNGIFGSVEEVIEFFDRGGGEGNTALKPLRLTPREKKDLAIFLVEALAGEEIVFTPPVIP